MIKSAATSPPIQIVKQASLDFIKEQVARKTDKIHSPESMYRLRDQPKRFM
jgi:hypothetical protein